jgi:uncharacterized membrane protein
LAAGALAALIGVLAIGAYWPFHRLYIPQVGGATGPLLARYLDWVEAGSPLWPWLVIWAFFLFLAYSFLAAEWVRARRRSVGERERAKVDQEGSREAGEQEGEGIGEPEAERVIMSGAEEGAEDTAAVAASLASPLEWEVAPETSPEIAASDEEEGEAERGDRGWLFGLLAVLGLAALLVMLERTTAALALAPLLLAVGWTFRRGNTARGGFLGLLLTLGLGILAGTELIYLRDFLQGGEWYRMNTLFKFGVPAWVLLGLAGGALWPRAWAATRRLPGAARLAWRLVALLLLLSGLAFIPFGIPARVNDRFPGARPAIGTLDGMAFMTVGRYAWPDVNHVIELPYDYLAIQWLLENAPGSPVVAEAPAGGYQVGGQFTGYDYYRAGGLRVASLTGLPTFVGHHQSEQRPWDQVGPRTELGQEFFATTDLERTQALIAELRVGYIYIGALERVLFNPESLAKFDHLVAAGDLAVAYRNPKVTVYRVIGRP